MPISLSRIEREYVIKNFRDNLPCLSIFANAMMYTILEKQYEFSDDTCVLYDSTSEKLRETSARVFFSHYQRKMYFDTLLKRNSEGKTVFFIPEEIYKDDTPDENSCKYRAFLKVADDEYKILPLPGFSPEAIFLDPCLMSASEERLRSLTNDQTFLVQNPFMKYRLYEYLKKTSEKMSLVPRGQGGHLIYLDPSQSMIALAKRLSIPYKTLSLHILIGTRIIQIFPTVDSSLTLPNNIHIYHFSFKDIQLEDKRFLYERIYKKKYIG